MEHVVSAFQEMEGTLAKWGPREKLSGKPYYRGYQRVYVDWFEVRNESTDVSLSLVENTVTVRLSLNLESVGSIEHQILLR